MGAGGQCQVWVGTALECIASQFGRANSQSAVFVVDPCPTLPRVLALESEVLMVAGPVAEELPVEITVACSRSRTAATAAQGALGFSEQKEQ